jgi:hypothetical protein
MSVPSSKPLERLSPIPRVEMALFGKKGWHRMTYIEAWAGGPNAVALDTVYGGFINVPRSNHAT